MKSSQTSPVGLIFDALQYAEKKKWGQKTAAQNGLVSTLLNST